MLPQCGSVLKGLPSQASNPHQGFIHSEHTRHQITSFQNVYDFGMLHRNLAGDKSKNDTG
jgi:hypothetical protein